MVLLGFERETLDTAAVDHGQRPLYTTTRRSIKALAARTVTVSMRETEEWWRWW